MEETECVPLGCGTPELVPRSSNCASRCPDLHAQGLDTQAGFYASSVPWALVSLETETSHYGWGLPSLSPAQQENSAVT